MTFRFLYFIFIFFFKKKSDIAFLSTHESIGVSKPIVNGAGFMSNVVSNIFASLA